MKDARLTIFAGHYGSGKTSLAINYAVYLRGSHRRVALVDLDIVNPYFRAHDGAEFLASYDIGLITTEYAGTNLDAPSVPARAATVFDDKDLHGIIDLGGDDRGAYAIGRYSERITAERSKSILLVINRCRPLSGTPDAVAEIRREIEYASGFKFTGIVNNTNLGAATKASDILESDRYAHKAAELTGLPLVMTSVRADLASDLKGFANLFEMEIFIGWKQS